MQWGSMTRSFIVGFNLFSTYILPVKVIFLPTRLVSSKDPDMANVHNFHTLLIQTDFLSLTPVYSPNGLVRTFVYFMVNITSLLPSLLNRVDFLS